MHLAGIGATIERAFGGLNPPPIEQLASDVRVTGDYVVEAVRFKTWRELRPLKRYFPDGWILASFSEQTFQYYLPAFLYALADGEDGVRYLDPVLEALGYRYSRSSFEQALSWLRSPEGEWKEAGPEMQREFLRLTDDERKREAQCRADIVLKMAEVAETKGVDWTYDAYRSSADRQFVERMATLTQQQKECVALTLEHILERSPDPASARRVQAILDRHWRSFLPPTGEAPDDSSV